MRFGRCVQKRIKMCRNIKFNIAKKIVLMYKSIQEKFLFQEGLENVNINTKTKIIIRYHYSL